MSRRRGVVLDFLVLFDIVSRAKSCVLSRAKSCVPRSREPNAAICFIFFRAVDVAKKEMCPNPFRR